MLPPVANGAQAASLPHKVAFKCILQCRHFMKATIVDLRYRMKDVLRAIDRGETVTVLYRGKEKAQLMPIRTRAGASNRNSVKTEDQPFFGMWSDREDQVDPVSYLRELRQPRRILTQFDKTRRSTVKKRK